jgi:hypothetical protein
MDMDSDFARSLVWDALRVCLPDTDLPEGEHTTLEEIGLETRQQRDHFKTTLVRSMMAAGYEIDPNSIPTGARDTPIRIMSVLPGESTKGNKL